MPLITDYSDQYLQYPKLNGLPKRPGRYWHRLEQQHLSSPDRSAYSLLTTVEIHPEGYPCCSAGRMDQMPGDWYGPIEERKEVPCLTANQQT